MPISFGGSGPESAKVKNTATITAAAARITRPEWATPPIIASRGVAAGLLEVLLGRGEQEHRVVHRDREDHREEEHRPPGVEEALRLEAEQRRRGGPSWNIEPGDAERRAGREQVREHADEGDDRRLQRDEQQQEAEREHDADHERRGSRERGLEVVVLGRGAADERAGGSVAAEPVDRVADRGVGRVLLGDRLHERVARRRSRSAQASRWRCPDRRGRRTRARRRLRSGATSCRAPGAPGPNAACTWV